MKRCLLPIILALLCLAACDKSAPACPSTGTPQYIAVPPGLLPSPAPAAPTEVRIAGKMMLVDKVVDGPLCNDIWSGIVYVTCNVQVYPWIETPTFLKDCNLVIQPGTVVYVAFHNDTAYYNGCSCHTGATATP